MSSLNKVFILRKYIIFSLILAVNGELKLYDGPFADLDENDDKQISFRHSSFLITKIRKSSDGLVVPGTKWCGPGNTAKHFRSLGRFRETDNCCRAHDNCDDIIHAGEERHGLKNERWFTSLNCKCDRAFFDCLHGSNSTVSNVIGKEYFYFTNKCFAKVPPIIDCIVYESTIFSKRCLKYSFNTNQKYQWLDLPYYGTSTKNLPKFNNTDSINKFYSELLERKQDRIIMN